MNFLQYAFACNESLMVKGNRDDAAADGYVDRKIIRVSAIRPHRIRTGERPCPDRAVADDRDVFAREVCFLRHRKWPSQY
jgi:hypothetical protein